MPAKRPASLAPRSRTSSLASQRLHLARLRRCSCRSRLAGEGARKPCTALKDAFAGKPAPTAGAITVVFLRGLFRQAKKRPHPAKETA
ncbi:hypothetical protein FEF10_29890 [Pseudomonas protegens]|uniref:DUF1534 domain-containing protein n=1 Tax=Pseudomonas protegens TaxID=380021 RepID=A0ABY2V9X8_9PSED|nr:hypothetical protein C1633_18230 [Pseudomonas protegens]TMM60659.1 hypothetical protein FEF10_29890 [Pseudomonas protegens]